MEMFDGAYMNLHSIVIATNPYDGFKDIDAAILMASVPRPAGSTNRADLLVGNAELFKSQGIALNEVAKKTVKVLVVSNPCNTNALIASTYAPSIPKENFSSMSRLDQTRSLS